MSLPVAKPVIVLIIFFYFRFKFLLNFFFRSNCLPPCVTSRVTQLGVPATGALIRC